MPATDVQALLVSLQLSDSAFPSGFYTMSHGLEGFAQARLVERGEVGDLLTGMLLHAVGPGDATALARAHEAAVAGDWARVREVDRLLHATKLNAEMRRASARSGHQLTDVARAAIGGPELDEWARALAAKEAPGCQAVATAVVYAAAGVGTRQAVVSDLFAFATSFLGAALRLRLTDHRELQVLLHAAAPVIEQAATDAVGRDLADMGGCVPMADVMSAWHERADGRLFTS
ncbi:urease accessory protein UreF [Cellulomonas xiejunii]|uniref:Urease accessory protein UreF n=1 Tax=Cellulomonas xiejunii TaxID=2968083 RepID=A0ABY5KSV1_9CELL|nr:urease accessory UreF family protein [Cellulomonas xiejunii]MCC2322993.1 urease accessory protein [Cellulomonas xiejunii]UUI73490.1 urease accessory protein [Cellulomonas xiejunii]